MKYKVGQKVRVVDCEAVRKDTNVSHLVGKIGKIVGIHKNSEYPIFLDISIHFCFKESEVEVIKVRSTKLARKIYPTWKEENGWLYEA